MLHGIVDRVPVRYWELEYRIHDALNMSTDTRVDARWRHGQFQPTRVRPHVTDSRNQADLRGHERTRRSSNSSRECTRGHVGVRTATPCRRFGTVRARVQIPCARPIPTYVRRRLAVPTSPRAQRSFDSTAPPAAIETSTKPPGFQQHRRWKRRRGACRESPKARGSTPPDV